MSVCLPTAGPAAGTTMDSYYLGKPGAMTRLDVNAGVSAPPTRAEVVHSTADGGTTTSRRRRVRRNYGLNLAALTPDQADPIVSYYSGARGRGPYALVDPTYRNHLSLDASTFWAAVGAVDTAWSVEAGDAAPVIDTTVASPVLGSAVGRWTVASAVRPLVNSGTFSAATLASFLASTHAVPYLTDQRPVLSVWVRSAATPTVTLAAYGATAAGGLVQYGTTASAVLVANTWTRLVLPVPAGALAATTETIHLGILGPAAAVLYLAGAQLEYGLPDALPWVTGLGCPRVTISAGMPGSSAVFWRRDHGLTLAEV